MSSKVVFSKNDFNEEGVNFLHFNDEFKIEDGCKIIFGYNGIGKSSIYKYLKEKRKDEYFFIDYEDKPKFIKSGKSYTISVDLSKINELKSKIGNINTKLSRTVYKDAANVNAAQMKKVFKNEIVKVSNIDESIFNEVKNILKKEEIITLIKKKDEIEKVGDAYKEACDYTNKYLLDVFNALDGHYDQTTTICPVCGSINVPLYNIIEEKKKQLQEISNNVFKDFDSIVAKSKEEQITII